MAMMYANENFPMPVVEELRRLSHDVLTIQETGKAEQSVTVEDVLAFASADRRAVLTLNRKSYRDMLLKNCHADLKEWVCGKKESSMIRQ